jgi:hypothetical protein
MVRLISNRHVSIIVARRRGIRCLAPAPANRIEESTRRCTYVEALFRGAPRGLTDTPTHVDVAR